MMVRYIISYQCGISQNLFEIYVKGRFVQTVQDRLKNRGHFKVRLIKNVDGIKRFDFYKHVADKSSSLRHCNLY